MNGAAVTALVPILCITAAAIAVMTAEAFRDAGERMPMAPLGAVGLVSAAVSTLLLWGTNATSFGLVIADTFGLFATGTLILVGLLSLALSGPTLEREHLPQGEYYALLLFALAGMVLMAVAVDLLVIFLALEVMSLAVYVLTAIRRNSPTATEAGFKYFLLGAFSSAFFLYGIAFVYGVTGSTRLDRVGSLIAAQTAAPTPLQLTAIGLLLVGFAFKVAAVPLHMWTPDAYEGAPPPVTGFMSTGVKAAAFAAFVRVFLTAFGPLRPYWGPSVAALAVLTMVFGTVVGVAQTNVKRLLAYSSIAHGGYLLVAIASASDLAKSSVLFYLLAYAVSNLGAFGIIGLLESEGSPNDRVTDYAGLWNERPGLALLMTIFLLSLGGFPPLAGFIAKWYVFNAAIDAGHTTLAIVGVLTSVVSVSFYLRIVVMMYMTPSAAAAPRPAAPRAARVALIVCAALVLYLGLLPARAMAWAAGAVGVIF